MVDKSKSHTLMIDTRRTLAAEAYSASRVSVAIETQCASDTSRAHTLWSSAAVSTSSSKVARTPSGSREPDLLLRKIDEFLAETTSALVKARRPQRLYINPCSRDLQADQQPSPEPRKPTIKPCSPVPSETEITSAMFDGCFAVPGTGGMARDASPFPYSPSGESSMLQVSSPMIRPMMDSEQHTAKSPDASHGRTRSGSLLSDHNSTMRASKAVEESVSSGDEEQMTPGHLASSSPYTSSSSWPSSSPSSSTSSRSGKEIREPARPHLSPTIVITRDAPERATRHYIPLKPASPPSRGSSWTATPACGLSRSASARSASNLTSPDSHPASTRTNETCIAPPGLADAVPTKRWMGQGDESPTSTQIVAGARKLNKLKQLLGAEVAVHLPTSPTCRGEKPLPGLPGPRIQRSDTTCSAPAPQRDASAGAIAPPSPRIVRRPHATRAVPVSSTSATRPKEPHRSEPALSAQNASTSK